MPRPTNHDARARVLADYAAGMSSVEAARRNGVPPSTANAWVRKSGLPKFGESPEVLTNGRWVICLRTRIQRWEVA